MHAEGALSVDILLVEDDEEDYLLTKDILARCNHGFQHSLDWVTDGAAALEAAGEREYDVCLVDYRLGPENGIGVIRSLLEHRDDLAAILLTGQGDHEVDIEAARAGASDYLVKGEVSPTLLERTIRYALRSRADLRALRESEARKTAILELALDAVVSVDDGGLIVDFNPAAETMFGYGRKSAVGRRLDELIVPAAERVPELDFFARDLATAEGELHAARVEKIAMRADGTEFPIELSVTRGELAGRPFFTGYIRDLTERRQAERERESLEAQLRQAQKMEALGRLVGGITHDFNNLLAVVSGYAELLDQSLEREDPRRAKLEQIRGATKRATGLTRQLLAFSRQQPLTLQVLDLNEVVRALEPMLAGVLGESVALTTSLDPELGHVRADATQIDQILMNLAVNARDAMPDGGTLTIETRNVETDAQPFVQLSVRDTGMGMDATTIAHAFEPFFTTKETGKGTGLGLSTIYGIVQQSEGSVAIESAPGEGTTFTILLPLVEAPLDPQGGLPASRLTRGAETILLVEDDEALLPLFRGALEAEGYTVMSATSGEAALQLDTERVDLLISDVVMPGIGGVALATELAARHPRLGILLVSGFSESGIADAQTGGLDVSFLRKPFSLADLSAKARELLDVRARA